MDSAVAQLSALRHLADEAMDAAARGADQANDSTAEASEAPKASNLVVNSACAADLESFCSTEGRVVALLREVQDSVAPAKMLSAMKNVHLCMARHADELSPSCVEALVTDMLGTSGAATTTPQLAARAPPVDDDSSVEINIFYSKHHRGGAMRHGGMSSTDAAHPFLWLLVLPFFVIGLYVTAKRGIVYARRRREERRIECKQQYVPVH